MPTWLDENTIQGEMSQQEFIKQVNNEMTVRVKAEDSPGNYGNDGVIPVYQEERSHAGVAYKLIVLRHFAVNRLPDGQFELTDRGMNRVGKYVVVEGKRPSYELRQLLNLDKFLWHHTLNAGQQDWSLKEQWEYAEKQATSDCQRNLEKEFETKVIKLRKELKNRQNVDNS